MGNFNNKEDEMGWNDRCSIEVLKGKTLKEIKAGDDEIFFFTADGEKYQMYHSQDCCENVSVESIIGDLNDLVGSEILTAEERTSSENPEGVVPEYQDSYTWTFYELATNKGSVTIRWYGESNGYYSEGVDFENVTKDEVIN